MAKDQRKSIKWIQKELDKCNFKINKQGAGETILIIDTTYFHKHFGVMVFRCAIRKKNLLWKFVDNESMEEYVNGVNQLENDGWIIKGIVCDGKRGLFNAFKGIPVQMCQFHQVQIITRYVTRRPKLSAGKDLRKLVFLLTETDETSFSFWLKEWHKKWEIFLNEKTYDFSAKKNRFIHRRLRSAYLSLKRNLPYLFTFERYINLNIPNTTNSLDGYFSTLKNKISVHRGLKWHRKKKIINELLSFVQPQKKFH